jgi:chemotaxis protein histidine kinase CheA
MNDLAIIEQGGVPALVAAIRSELAPQSVDLTTVSGRKAVASAAYAVAQRKVAVDGALAAQLAEWKEKVKAGDAWRREIKTALQSLQDEVRAPLTAWETEQERYAANLGAIRADVVGADGLPLPVEVLRAQVARLAGLALTPENYGDQCAQAAIIRDTALAAAQNALARAEEAEAQAAEIARLRAVEAEAQRQAEIKRQAEAEAARMVELARLKEEAARREAEDAQRRAAEAEARRAAEADEAQRRATEAEARRVAEAEEAQRRAIAQAEAAAARAKAQAEADAAARAKAEADAAAARAADKEHRGAVNRAAVAALIEHAGLSEQQARAVVVAIVAGKVPAVSVKY